MGFKAFHSARPPLKESKRLIRFKRDSCSDENIPAYKQFMVFSRITLSADKYSFALYGIFGDRTNPVTGKRKSPRADHHDGLPALV